LLLGIALLLVGVGICAVAGSLRDKAKPHLGDQPRKNATPGLILAILCGALASLQNFGIAFGAPILALATQHGANPANAANAIWMPLLMAGALPNLLYCAWLLRKHSTGVRFAAGGVSHWFLAFVMGAFWFGSLLFYGAAVPRLGSLGPALGWPLYMSLIVVAASLVGIATGEWKQSGRRPVTIQLCGVAMLIVAIVILARATQAMA